MDEGYFSHLPLLAAAIHLTTGPVLELGAGLGSTLMLHGLCGGMYRELTTIDSNPTWLGKFVSFKRSWHTMKLVNSFLNLPEYVKLWGLAFVDHGIAEERGQSVLALKDSTSIIVCHDSCHYFLYGYEPILSEFRFRWNYQPHGLNGNPMTTVVSQTINVGLLFGEVGL